AGAAGVHVIFDASGSMGQLLPSGESRMAAAKQALEGLIGAALEEATPFSLRAFGHVTPNSCETRLDVRRGPLDRAAALAAVRAIEPKLLSQTAIADSLLLAVDDLAGSTGPRTVILITDGKEPCGRDPAAAAAALRAAGDTTSPSSPWLSGQPTWLSSSRWRTRSARPTWTSPRSRASAKPSPQR